MSADKVFVCHFSVLRFVKRSHLVCLIVSISSEFFTSVLSPCFLFLGFNFLSLNLGARLLATVSDRVNELTDRVRGGIVYEMSQILWKDGEHSRGRTDFLNSTLDSWGVPSSSFWGRCQERSFSQKLEIKNLRHNNFRAIATSSLQLDIMKNKIPLPDMT